MKIKLKHGDKVVCATCGKDLYVMHLPECFRECGAKEDWKPKPGDKVYWDGVALYESGAIENKFPSGVHVLYNVLNGYKVPYTIKVNASSYFTTLDHLSPVNSIAECAKEIVDATRKIYDVQRKGKVCDAPRQYAVSKEGVFVFKDDFKQPPKEGDYALGESSYKNVIFKSTHNFESTDTRWILTHIVPKYKEGDEVTCTTVNYTFKITSSRYDERLGVYVYHEDNRLGYFTESSLVPSNPKPEPKFKKGQWVTHVDFKKLFQVGETFYKDDMFWYNTERGIVTAVGEPKLRLAIPSDWAKEFDGVKIYLYKDKFGNTWSHLEAKFTRNYILNDFEVAIYTAAGILTVPKEVCDGN